MLLTQELAILNDRVKELRTIVTSLTLKEACSSIAYANYEQSTNFTDLHSNIDTLFEYAIAHKYPIVFDDDVQEIAFKVLEKCYEVRCDSEYGFLLGDSDIIAGLCNATGCVPEVGERFFNQHYTKQGVNRC